MKPDPMKIEPSPPPKGIFGDARDEHPELGECRVAREINFTRIYASILSHLLMRMKESYPSEEAENEHIAMLSWRAFKAAKAATNILFDQRFFDRRFIGDEEITTEFNASISLKEDE
jgi:hypothetical protein